MAKDCTISSPSWLSLLGLIGVLGCGYAPAQAQQFSADLVRATPHDGATTSVGKLRVFDGRVRIEMPDFQDGFFLIDGASCARHFAPPVERVFMDARQSIPLTYLFVPVDVGAPCLQWQAMAKLAGA